MTSRNTPYIAKLDHLRFLAAFLVIVYHYYHFHTGFYNGFKSPSVIAKSVGSALIIDGHVGVSLFLVLSGFIFSTIAYGRKIHYGHFIGNRLLRIMPLYGTAIGIACLLSAPSLAQLIASLTFTNGFIPGVSDIRITPHLWTIALEFQFYLLFPFLVVFMHRIGMRHVAALILLLVCIRLFLWCSKDLKSLRAIAYSTLVGRLDQFLIGMVAGAIYCGRGPSVPKWLRGIWTPLVGLAIAVGSVWAFHRAGGYYNLGEHHWFWIIWTPLEGVAWAALVLSYCVSRFELPAMLSRPLAFLGTLSFSLYVNHWLFVHNVPFHRWIPQLLDNYPMNALLSVLIAVLPVLVPFSCLTYYVIEKPFFELRRSYIVKDIPKNGSAPPEGALPAAVEKPGNALLD